MGLYPPLWGNHQWTTLHIMAAVYPTQPSKERQEAMLQYLNGMSYNLPCPQCSYHCTDYFHNNPPMLDSRDNLKKYIYDFHNSVNKRLGKRELSFEECEEQTFKTFSCKGRIGTQKSSRSTKRGSRSNRKV